MQTPNHKILESKDYNTLDYNIVHLVVLNG